MHMRSTVPIIMDVQYIHNNEDVPGLDGYGGVESTQPLPSLERGKLLQRSILK
jgi:hypothetical protein